MPLNASTRSQQPLNSLATKLILFVFISTFVTALVVSGISIQSTHSYLSEQIGQQYPAALGQAGEALLEWFVAGQEEITNLASDDALRRGAPRESAGNSSSSAQLASAQRRSRYFDAYALVGGDSHVRRVVGEATGLAPGRRLRSRVSTARSCACWIRIPRECWSRRRRSLSTPMAPGR